MSDRHTFKCSDIDDALKGNLRSRIIRGIQYRRDARRRVDISDEYVKWLCFANAGMLERGNLYCFDYAITHLPSAAPIIEIGSFCGLSTNLLTYYKEKHGVLNDLITTDKWQFEGSSGASTIGKSNVTHAEYRKLVKESFIRNAQTFSRNALPYTVEMFSDEFFQAWQKSSKVNDVFGRSITLGGPISFCYVDGDHSYDAVKRDFIHCDEFLENGGFILFDDSADSSDWEVRKVIAEIKKDRRYEVVINNPNYLFRKK